MGGASSEEVDWWVILEVWHPDPHFLFTLLLNATSSVLSQLLALTVMASAAMGFADKMASISLELQVK